MTAMSTASPEVIIALLKAGANTNVRDVDGLDPFMYAAKFGNVEAMKTWISKTKHNINERDSTFGSTALHFAVHFGRNKSSTVKFLIQTMRADVMIANYSGHNALTLACSSVDADPTIVRYILNRSKLQINHKARSRRGSQWLKSLAQRFKLAGNGFVHPMAHNLGCTALHYAIQRGDLEISEMLLALDADISATNDRGRSVLEYASMFPRIKRSLWRIQKEEKEMRGNRLSTLESTVGSSQVFSLTRRTSTATPLKYNMYLVKLSTLFELFGTWPFEHYHLSEAV